MKFSAEILKFRAVQAECPTLTVNQQTDEKTKPVRLGVDINLGVYPSGIIPTVKQNMAALCAKACVYNPNTETPELRDIVGANKLGIACTGVCTDKSAVLTLEKPKKITEVALLAPCGKRLQESDTFTLLTGRKIEDKNISLKKPVWHDFLGRYVTHVIQDYTRDPDLLTQSDIKFLNANNRKHVVALRYFIASSTATFTGLAIAGNQELNTAALIGSLGFITVFGGAWFTISFSNIMKAFENASIETTKNMLAAFEVFSGTSLASIAASVTKVAPTLSWPLILIPMAIGAEKAIRSVIQFDTADAFNRGLTGAALAYYERFNIILESLGIDPTQSVEETKEALQQWKTETGSAGVTPLL